MTDQPRHVPDTLGEQPSEHHIWAWCPRCDRHFEASIPELIKRLGEGCPTTEAMTRVTCRQCRKPVRTWRGWGQPIA